MFFVTVLREEDTSLYDVQVKTRCTCWYIRKEGSGGRIGGRLRDFESLIRDSIGFTRFLEIEIRSSRSNKMGSRSTDARRATQRIKWKLNSRIRVMFTDDRDGSNHYSVIIESAWRAT